MISIWQYVSAGLGVIVIGMVWYYTTTVDKLENNLMRTQTELAEQRYKTIQYKASIDKQNGYIEDMKHDLEAKQKVLIKWKTLPPEIRYNVIYKEIPKDMNLTKDSCENTKDIISAIRDIDLNNL